MQTECGLENPDLLNNWIEGNIKVLQSVWLHVQHLFLETSRYKSNGQGFAAVRLLMWRNTTGYRGQRTKAKL